MTLSNITPASGEFKVIGPPLQKFESLKGIPEFERISYLFNTNSLLVSSVFVRKNRKSPLPPFGFFFYKTELTSKIISIKQVRNLSQNAGMAI